MIFDSIVTVLGNFLGWLGGLFGHMPVPSFLSSIDSGLATLGGYASGMGQFIPLTDAVNAMTFVAACIGIGFAIKVVRIIVSFFTAGGGSAA